MSKERPGLRTIAAGAVASAAAFFVLTQLGLFGTVTGAVIASVIYATASHWIGWSLERGRGWMGSAVGRYRPAAVEVVETGEAAPAPDAAPQSEVPAGAETPAEPETPSGARRARLGMPGPAWRRRALLWGPAAFSLLAVAASAYTVAGGGPLERVIIREVVREKPVVEERVVVQRETVTVTVPVAVPVLPPGAPVPSVSDSSRGGDRRTDTASPPTTVTALPGSTTTITAVPPPVTPSTVPGPAPAPETTTTAPPAASGPPDITP